MEFLKILIYEAEQINKITIDKEDNIVSHK